MCQDPYLDTLRTSFTISKTDGGHRGRDRMVAGFTTIYGISAYHH